jgi:hypothetical protein
MIMIFVSRQLLGMIKIEQNMSVSIGGRLMDLTKIYFDAEGNERNILEMVRREPNWAANRIQEGEKAIENMKTEKRFACHIDIGHSDPECVLDTGNYQDCEEAGLLKEDGKGKADCEFWHLVEE